MCPPSSESSVRWCCSASVSVGAMNAAWAPFSTARSMAASATAVLPLPTSPISSRCIGRSRARSASISADGARLVAGQLERQRPPPPVHHHSARRERARLPALAPRAPPPRHRELEQEQLLEREPAARLLLVVLALREVHGVEHGGALRQTLLDAQARGQRLDRRARQRARLADERAQSVRGDALRGRMDRHASERVDGRVPVAEQLVVLHPELVPLAQLAVEQDVRALGRARGRSRAG